MGWKGAIGALVGLGGVLAGVTHAALRLVYLQFYGPLGITPEEVGLGRTEMVLQTLAGPAVVVLVGVPVILTGLASLVVLLLLLSVVFVLLRGLYFETKHRRPSGSPAEGRSGDRGEEGRFGHGLLLSLRRWWARLTSTWHRAVDLVKKRWFLAVGAAVLASAAMTASDLVWATGVAAFRVADGQPVYAVPIYSDFTGYLPEPLADVPALQLRAIPARVTIDGQPVQGLPEAPGEAFYLGTDGDHLAFYVPRERRTVRIPFDDVVMELEAESHPFFVFFPPFDAQDSDEVLGADGEPAWAEIEFTISPFREIACYRLLGTNFVSPPTRFHLHERDADESGAGLITFSRLETSSTRNGEGQEPGTWGEDCVQVSGNQAAAIVHDPSRYYLHLHNHRIPGGSWRGYLW